MQGKPDVLALLGDLLANELTAINQYLLHGKLCEDWGYRRLSEKLLGEAGGERGHADKLIERILFLSGTPDLNRYHPIQGGSSVKELLERDLKMEYDAIAALDDGIARCRAAGDNATEALLTEIIVGEQEDTQWIEAQLSQIRQIGEPSYLAQQL